MRFKIDAFKLAYDWLTIYKSDLVSRYLIC